MVIMDKIKKWMDILDNRVYESADLIALEQENEMAKVIDQFNDIIHNRKMIDHDEMKKFYNRHKIKFIVNANQYFINKNDLIKIFKNEKLEKADNYIDEGVMFNFLRDPKYKKMKCINNFLIERMTILHNITNEYFKPVYGYEDLYLVSNFGRVFSKKSNTILKQRISNGYYSITVFGKEYRSRKCMDIHKAMGKTFLLHQMSDNKKEIDHINGNPNDNRLENLRYITPHGNSKNSYVTGNRVSFSRIVSKYDISGKFLKRYKSAEEAQKDNDVSAAHILRCCEYNKKNPDSPKIAKGFIWKYSSRNVETKIKLRKNEVFRKIKKYNGHRFDNYELSNYGTLRNIKTKRILKPANHAGYYRISIQTIKYKSIQIYVHILVAHLFCDKPEEYNDDYTVIHLDKDKYNNYYKNLQWAPAGTGIVHAVGISVEKYDLKTGDTIETFPSIRKAAVSLGNVNKETDIRECCRGNRQHAGGYGWRYAK